VLRYILIVWMSIFTGLVGFAQDDGEPQTCTQETKIYNEDGFQQDDFLSVDQGVIVDNAIRLDTDRELDLENLLLGLDQPFIIDFLEEGAGASHMFGFFFWDIDTDKDGLPDFYETGPDDDLDGDTILNRDDDDDDNDGIPDSADKEPAGVNSMPPGFYKQGITAANNGLHIGDYWQFVPNNKINAPGDSYDGYYEMPGAYLYVDNNDNQVPDSLEYNTGNNKVPHYIVDKSFTGYHVNQGNKLGMLGVFPYAGTPGDTQDDKYHWTGSTVFYIADDDGGTGQTGDYLSYSPYGNLYSDVMSSTNGNPDYLLYGTTDARDARIPQLLKNDNGTPNDSSDDTHKVDARGTQLYKYRWHRSNISGARELVFWLVVYYGSGGSNVNTYYSKSAFNKDIPRDVPVRNGATSGDAYGGWTGKSNWFPEYDDGGDHNDLARGVFNDRWRDITDVVDGKIVPSTEGIARGVTQDWIDKWGNRDYDRRVIQYRALRDWFRESAVDADEIINGRYGIDMSGENESSVIRAINGRYAHLMVGAPSTVKNAWLLGWEDLFQGGDKDYEDVAFYVKREAGGQIQSLNVAQSLADQFEDYSLSQVTFKFVDDFTDGNWGIPGRYINYYYRLGSADTWIPLLGGYHERSIDMFQPENGGTTTTVDGKVTREVTIEIHDKKQEVYWKAEIATDNVDIFKPKITDAEVSFKTLVHDFFYFSAIIPNSNIQYIANFESVDLSWLEKNRNRGHLYALRSFEHGNPPTPLTVTVSPELNPETQPVPPFEWDAGVTMKTSLDADVDRTIYTYSQTAGNETHSNSLDRKDLSKDAAPSQLVSALELSTSQVNGVWRDNFHEPDADEVDPESAALWLSNWLHGYQDPLVVEGAVLDRGPKREWILGGINRSASVVIRPPGIPTWLSGADVPVADKRSYLEFIDTDAQAELPTRVIIGTESGMVHCFEAGQWVGEKENDDDQWADGHYKSGNYGTGREVWGFLAGHLLEDIKYNYNNASPVTARIESTATTRVIKVGPQDWRRIVVFSQGYQGGSKTYADGKTRTGNVVWALDITNPDDPQPLWHFASKAVQDIVNPVAIGWAEINNTPRWIVAFSTGATPIADSKAGFMVLDAFTGELISAASKATSNADPNVVMQGSPALLDTDDNGYIDHLVGANSAGEIFTFNINTLAGLNTQTVPGARFYTTPNVRVTAGGQIMIVATAGDDPFTYDHDQYTSSDFVNSVSVFEFEPKDGTFSSSCSVDLPTRHKAFARPILVGNRLVVGTTTGDTPNICDFDPDDPGDLVVFDLTGCAVEDSFESFGSIIAPLRFYGDQILVHSNTSKNSDPSSGGSPFQKRTTAPKPAQPQPTVVAEIFGILGTQDNVLENLRLNNTEENNTP